MKVVALFAALLFLNSNSALAVCNGATGGTVRYDHGLMLYCENAQYWRQVGDLVGTGNTCTAGEEGKFSYNATDGVIFCDGSSWYYTDGGGSGSGACTAAGKQRYNTGSNLLEFCNGSTWRTMASSMSNPVTLCSTHGTQVPCDADTACHWNGSSCEACNCKR